MLPRDKKLILASFDSSSVIFCFSVVTEMKQSSPCCQHKAAIGDTAVKLQGSLIWLPFEAWLAGFSHTQLSFSTECPLCWEQMRNSASSHSHRFPKPGLQQKHIYTRSAMCWAHLKSPQPHPLRSPGTRHNLNHTTAKWLCHCRTSTWTPQLPPALLCFTSSGIYLRSDVLRGLELIRQLSVQRGVRKKRYCSRFWQQLWQVLALQIYVKVKGSWACSTLGKNW